MPQKIFKLRQGFAILFFRMLIVEILVASLYSLLQYLTDGLLNTFFIPQIFNLTLLSYVLLRWTTTYYIITPNEITAAQGIVFRDRATWKVNAIQSVTMRQSFLGRIFNYGTVHLESPFLKKDFYFRNIPEPELYAEYLENTRAKALEDNAAAVPRRF